MDYLFVFLNAFQHLKIEYYNKSFVGFIQEYMPLPALDSENLLEENPSFKFSQAECTN